MLLTKLWAAILAVLATAFLAGMFLLSLGTSGGFTDADRAAVQAVTEAGLAALEAQIQASPVQLAPALLTDGRLKAIIDGEEQGKGEEANVEQIVADVSEENLLSDYPEMTVGLIDENGTIVGANGVAEHYLGEVVAAGAYQTVATGEEALFTATLGGQLHVVKVSRAGEAGLRLAALQALDIDASSMLRRVLGTGNPAGIVREGKLLGDIIGEQPIRSEIEALARAHIDGAPDSGASQVFVVGEGLDARIGCLGRVPGPAGRGQSGTMLGVLSRETAAAGQKDLAQALRHAKAKGLLGQLNWLLLGGLLIVSVGLAVYLPSLEALNPMRRLTNELLGVAQGSQPQIFHDRYGGTTGQLARAAAAAHEALRSAYLAELEIEDDDEEGEQKESVDRPRTTGGRRAGRTSRRSRGVRRTTPKPQPPAPAADAAPPPAPAPAAGSPSETREAPIPDEPPANAPPLQDEVAEDEVNKAAAEEAAALAASLGGGAPAKEPGADPSPPLVPPGQSSDGDDKEAYFREIYDEFVQVKMTCGEATENFTFEKFARKLRKNTQELKKRPGVRDVEFTVYVKDGKAALKAKVIRG